MRGEMLGVIKIEIELGQRKIEEVVGGCLLALR